MAKDADLLGSLQWSEIAVLLALTVAAPLALLTRFPILPTGYGHSDCYKLIDTIYYNYSKKSIKNCCAKPFSF